MVIIIIIIILRVCSTYSSWRVICELGEYQHTARAHGN